MSKKLKKKLAVLQQHYPTLHKKYHIQRIGIFGSVARGHERPGSDIDIIVELNQPIGLFSFFELEQYLSSVLHQQVDVVTKKSIKPILKKEILKETFYA